MKNTLKNIFNLIKALLKGYLTKDEASTLYRGKNEEINYTDIVNMPDLSELGVGRKSGFNGGEIFNLYTESEHGDEPNDASESWYGHAEGISTYVSGDAAHAEGIYTQASGQASHTEGFDTSATTDFSHAEGEGTQTTNGIMHAEGHYNDPLSQHLPNTILHEVGNGTSNSNKSNAYELDKQGNGWYAGDVTIHNAVEFVYDSTDGALHIRFKSQQSM